MKLSLLSSDLGSDMLLLPEVLVQYGREPHRGMGFFTGLLAVAVTKYLRVGKL